MRLFFSSSYITDTVLLDDIPGDRRVYAFTSSTFLRQTKVLKFGPGTSGSSGLATIRFHYWRADRITMGGQELIAKDYLAKPSWSSKSVTRAVACQTKAITDEYYGMQSQGVHSRRWHSIPMDSERDAEDWEYVEGKCLDQIHVPSS